MEASQGVVCAAHPDAYLIEDSRAGDTICSACGLVIGSRVIDVSQEWRCFGNESGGADRCRVGGPENPLFSGELTTLIGPSSSKSLSNVGSRNTLNNALGLTAPTYKNNDKMSSSDRTLLSVFKEINNMAHRINLPQSIVDRANNMFKKIYNGGTLKGRSNDAKAASCVYIACRQEGVPRTFKEICAVSKVSKKEIGRCFKIIISTLETNIDVITSDDFMPRFCANLLLPLRVEIAAVHIAKNSVDMDIMGGKSPISIAAAAIYMASQASSQKRSQKIIADVAGVADTTIRQAYKVMYEHRDKLFPANFEFDTPLRELPSN